MVDGVVIPAGERSGAVRLRRSSGSGGHGSVRRARPPPRRSPRRGVRAGPAGRRSRSSCGPACPAPTRSSPRPPGTWSRPAGSGSGRCWWRWARSSATRPAPQVVPAAVVMELTHLATLYHDDVMDEAAVRRGAPSANSRWTNSVAILVGDYLFARAADIAADLGPEAVRLQARTFARLVHGQIAETVGPARRRRPGRPLPARDRREDRLADRHVGPVRRHVRRCRRASTSTPSPGTARRSASPSSSPTTCSTSPPSRASRARPPAPTCARACRRCRCSTRAPADDSDASSVRLREILATGPLTDDALHAEALGLLRESPGAEAGPGDRPQLRRGRPRAVAQAADPP